MSRSPRGCAIEHYRQETFRDIPETPDYVPGSPEALQFLENIRERRYASLAYAIKVTLDHAFEQAWESEDVGGGLYLRSHRQASSDMLAAVHKTILASRDSEAYQIGRNYRDIVNALADPASMPPTSLERQLTAGTGTAKKIIGTEVRSTRHILSAHDPKGIFAGQTEIIARNSVNLSAMPAMTSINQMEGAREALLWNGLWISSGTRLINPDRCVLQPTKNGSAIITYADFWGMVAPAPGHARNAERLMDIEVDTPVRDIQPKWSKTIGCPITLIPGGYLRVLRDRYINRVVEYGGL